MTFRNTNNYTETSSAPWLWCLLFGFIYLLYKRLWGHAIISFILAIPTYGLSWIIYAFFASSIVRNNYLRNGWVEVDGKEKNDYNYGGYIALVFLAIFVLYTYMNMQGVK